MVALRFSSRKRPDFRLGKLTRYLSTAADPVTAEIDAALEWFVEQGAEIVELEVPNLDALLNGSMCCPDKGQRLVMKTSVLWMR